MNLLWVAVIVTAYWPYLQYDTVGPFGSKAICEAAAHAAHEIGQPDPHMPRDPFQRVDYLWPVCIYQDEVDAWARDIRWTDDEYSGPR